MKECPYCHHDLPNDSEFCQYCGKSLVSGVPVDVEESEPLKENPDPNNIGKMAIIVFLVGLIGFDFILSTIVENVTGNSKWVFYISFVIYMISLLLGVMSIVKDKKDKQNGYMPSDNAKIAWAAIVFSVFVSLVNLMNVILK